MQLLNDKIDGSGGPENILPAAEWNQLPTELQNIITALGMTLSNGDLNQLGKALAGYVANGAFYTDSGVADAYVLNTVGGKQSLTEYTDGAKVEFIATNPNTGAATVNVTGLGAKGVRTEDGLVVIAGMISGRTSLIYDAGAGWFVIQLSDEWFINTTLHADISTASPPTTENVTAIHRVVDRTGANLLAEMGFSANENLRIKNHMEGANTQLWGVESGGVARLLFDGVPGGRSTLHFDSDPAARTADTANGGFEIDNQLTGAGFERALTESDNVKVEGSPVVLASDFSNTTTTLQDVTGMGDMELKAGGVYLVVATLSVLTTGTSEAVRLNLEATPSISGQTMWTGAPHDTPGGTSNTWSIGESAGVPFDANVSDDQSLISCTGIWTPTVDSIVKLQFARAVGSAAGTAKVFAGSAVAIIKVN